MHSNAATMGHPSDGAPAKFIAHARVSQGTVIKVLNVHLFCVLAMCEFFLNVNSFNLLSAITASIHVPSTYHCKYTCY